MAYAVTGRCPICGGTLLLSEMQHFASDATITGHFYRWVCSGLRAEPPAFVELVIRCEGNTRRVEEELEPLYPTVSYRLGDLVRALGYSVRESLRPPAEERRSTLERLSSGDLLPGQAIELMAVK